MAEPKTSRKLSPIKVTVEDVETNKSESSYVPEDSYIIVTAGRMYVAHEAIHRSGTVQLTLKLDKGD